MNAYTSAISPEGRAKAANKRYAEFLNRNATDARPPVEGRARAALDRFAAYFGDDLNKEILLVVEEDDSEEAKANRARIAVAVARVHAFFDRLTDTSEADA